MPGEGLIRRHENAWECGKKGRAIDERKPGANERARTSVHVVARGEAWFVGGLCTPDRCNPLGTRCSAKPYSFLSAAFAILLCSLPLYLRAFTPAYGALRRACQSPSSSACTCIVHLRRGVPGPLHVPLARDVGRDDIWNTSSSVFISTFEITCKAKLIWAYDTFNLATSRN